MTELRIRIPINHISIPKPNCEKNIEKMFNLTLIPLFRSKRAYIKWTIPILSNLLIIGSSFCIIWYPTYYINQPELWTTDLALGSIIYSYLLYLQYYWDTAKSFELQSIPRWKNIICICFYVAFMLYWAYFAVIMFMLHSEKSIQIQLGNVIMSSAWYIFFSVCSSIYYFTNVKLIQRTESINDWLLDMKQTHPTIENFYKVYDSHYTSIRRFAANWNFIIFLGFILLSFHIPFDLISVIYDKNYHDIFGTIVKSLALIWYLFCICSLNNCETKIISYLYKYRIFTLYHMKSIEQYMIYRPIGLNFYGIKINTTTIMKITIISFNLLIPTIYAIVKNFIKDLPTSS